MVSKTKAQDVVCNICSSGKRKLIFENERYNEILKIHQGLNCGLVYLSPRPTHDELCDYYSQIYDYGGFLKNTDSNLVDISIDKLLNIIQCELFLSR